ncbi:hypothetical protein [Castellaniella sp.]|uniref:hypothetical protein n=1 Tax=Castellaniella sp. TaxID=1955812 RepID=UPI002AFFB72A|nr:hypothetical protein [Castellaniella sp.]
MRIVEQFNETVDRELARLPKDQEVLMEHAMAQFDALVRSGAIQPERYKLEPIGTISLDRRPQTL